jgi:hypothetical protein
MDFALAVGIYLLGVVSGVLVCMAIMSKIPAEAEEPTETGVLPHEPFIIPMPPVRTTKGRRPL